ncbi:hypothetical protein I6N95_26765 [Vagococcus sp. BWB3-3]|uniref:Uncharacterized protein n=1 Tax=Vagococcus allomyrinae TaxID=2794353 RepID=A0A940PKN6_9ENTE|nr:hypothetical protein [Vagococcus allomyrinae]MBP1044618.1 hypothetical protein [Vagococcus allomyrinae]
MKTKKKQLVIFYVIFTLFLLGMTKTVHSLIAAPLAKDRETFTVEVEDLHVQIKEEFPTVSQMKLDTAYKKEVEIENKTNGDMFVRVMILPTLETDEAKVFSQRLGKEVILTGMDSKWIDGQDGYYYYTDVIKDKEKSDFLMKTVKLTNHSLSGGKETFAIQLKVESVNTSKNGFVEAWWNNAVPAVTNVPYYTIFSALDGLTPN